MSEFLLVLSVGSLAYGCSRSTGTEVWEWLKSAAIICTLLTILYITGYWLLLAA